MQRFYATASPIAQELAEYLAAAPLSLPVMRLVQRVMLPESRQVHLAEVFLGGLIKRVSGDDCSPLGIGYDFHVGVRDLLLDSVLLPDAVDVLKEVSQFLENRMGNPLDFMALLADPSAVDGMVIDEENRAFAEIGAGVLERLGGEYRELLTKIVTKRTQKIQIESQKQNKVVKKKKEQQTKKYRINRYTDNGDGTVIDNRTGLIWLKNACYFGEKTWKIAMEKVASLAHGKCELSDNSVQGDWRLPTIDEWRVMIDEKYRRPVLSNTAGTDKWKEGDAFCDVQNSYYWSSSNEPSLFSRQSYTYWLISLSTGSFNETSSTYISFYVWPVRNTASSS